MSEQNQNEAQTVANLAISSRVLQEGCEVPFVVVPNGYTMHDLEKLQAAPRRVREAVKMTSVDSFIEYVKARRNERTVIFADEAARSLRAVIDYHGEKGEPSWCDHSVHYVAAFSREWLAWIGNHNKAMNQIAFADFIEERVSDVVEPSGAALLEIATKFHVVRKAVFGSAVRLASGEFQFQYSDENEKKGTIEVPEKIAIGIPVFHKGSGYRIEARLRYRLEDGGKLSFTYKLVEPEHTVESAFAKQRAQVAEALVGLPIYDGSK
jgi:uncharacterized protein YfdQ (DUF2303 family)